MTDEPTPQERTKRIEELLSVIPEGSRADFDPPRPTEVRVERRDMLPRPEGMSRQVHRRLYRKVCEMQRIEPQFERPNTKKVARAERKQATRAQFDQLSRSERNRLRKYTNAQRHQQ